jgi:hypothetical protein
MQYQAAFQSYTREFWPKGRKSCLRPASHGWDVSTPKIRHSQVSMFSWEHGWSLNGREGWWMIRYGVKNEDGFPSCNDDWIVVNTLVHTRNKIVYRIFSSWSWGPSIPPDNLFIIPRADENVITRTTSIPDDRLDRAIVTSNVSWLSGIFKIKKSNSLFVSPRS